MANSSLKQKPIYRTLLLLTLILSCAVQSHATEFTHDGLTYTTLTDNTCEISAHDSVSGDLVIPETVYDNDGNAYTVTSIGDYAFSFCEDLTSVTIHKYVTSIGEDAFKDCTNLQKVNITDLNAWCRISFSSNSANPLYCANHLYLNDTEVTELEIPESFTSIGNYVFTGCEYLTSVTIPNAVTSIGNGAFRDCTGLTTITIPNAVTSIGNNTFEYCEGLTSVTIPNSVTSIGEYAFKSCTGLTSVSIPNSITEIARGVFQGCTGLTSVTIPNTIASIGAYAFWKCEGLTSVAIPNSVSSIGKYAFYNCTGLTSVTIPSSVTLIEDAFYRCLNITTVNFDDGESELTLTTSVLKSVAPTEVYFGRQMDFTTVPCSALKTVTFGEYVTSIEDGAFSEASALRSVTSHSTVPPTIGEATFANDTYSAGVLYVPESSIATYQGAAGWNNFLSIKAIESTGISDINSDATFSIENGAICVNGDSDVRIVSMTGATAYSGRGETRINVASGIYIVIIGNKATKVSVR